MCSSSSHAALLLLHLLFFVTSQQLACTAYVPPPLPCPRMRLAPPVLNAEQLRAEITDASALDDHPSRSAFLCIWLHWRLRLRCQVLRCQGRNNA